MENITKNDRNRVGTGIGLSMLMSAAALLAVGPAPVQGAAADDLAERAANAATVLEEISDAPDRQIPRAIAEEAHCIAVIPKVVKAGFIVAGRHGEGLLSCRTADGWSRPAYVSISGGSIGLQIGVQATDFVLVFADERAVEYLYEDNFTLGGDASISAGPVGRTAEAGTDVELDSEIYSYSRSKGAFAGVSLEGARLAIDDEANREVYGDAVTAQGLLTSSGSEAPGTVFPFIQALDATIPAHQH